MLGKIKKLIPIPLKQAVLNRCLKKYEAQCIRAVEEECDRNIILLIDNVHEKDAYPLDNITLFKYIQAHPESGYESVYIIKSDNEMAQELVQQYGQNILLYDMNSPAFYKRFIEILRHTRYLCDSFQTINSWIYRSVRASRNVDSIFTQHGVTFFKEDFITPDMYGQNIYDKVMVSNEWEEELLVKRGNYDRQNIIRNGLFRWDNLQDISHGKRIVFVYITFRRYLLDAINDGTVDSCRYIQTIKQLFGSERLQDILKQNNIELNVGLHHVLTGKLDKNLFTGYKLVSEEEIGKAKREAKLLITDYSSMCFEVMQQQKPVIFYNIGDSEDCLKYGYSNDMPYPYKGKEQYLYNLARSTDELLDIFEKIIANNFQISEQEEEINNQFFFYRDNYCERFLKQLNNN